MNPEGIDPPEWLQIRASTARSYMDPPVRSVAAWNRTVRAKNAGFPFCARRISCIHPPTRAHSDANIEIAEWKPGRRPLDLCPIHYVATQRRGVTPQMHAEGPVQADIDPLDATASAATAVFTVLPSDVCSLHRYHRHCYVTIH